MACPDCPVNVGECPTTFVDEVTSSLRDNLWFWGIVAAGLACWVYSAFIVWGAK